MILYILIFISIVFLSIVDIYLKDDIESTRLKNILTIAIIVALSFVSGTRLLGGTDYKRYVQAYKYVPTITQLLNGHTLKESYYIKAFENGYLLINSVFKSVGIPFTIFTLIHSLFFNFSMYYGLKKYCKRFSIVLLVFISKLFFYNTFISMRQSITIAIFFLSLKLIENRKFISYLLVCVLCFFIHNGSFIMLPVYFVNNIRISKKRVMLYVGILSIFAIVNMLHLDFVTLLVKVVGGALSGTFIATKILPYADGTALSPIYLLEYWAIAILLLKNYDEIISLSDNSEFIIKLFLFLYLFFTIFGGISIITREKDYFILTYAILLNWLMLVKDCHYRNVILIVLCLISGAEFFRYILAFDNGDLLNYSSWLYNMFIS